MLISIFLLVILCQQVTEVVDQLVGSLLLRLQSYFLDIFLSFLTRHQLHLFLL